MQKTGGAQSPFFIRALEVSHLDPLIQMLLFTEGFSSTGLAKETSWPTKCQPQLACPGRQGMGFPRTQLPSGMSSAASASPEMNF